MPQRPARARYAVNLLEGGSASSGTDRRTPRSSPPDGDDFERLRDSLERDGPGLGQDEGFHAGGGRRGRRWPGSRLPPRGLRPWPPCAPPSAVVLAPTRCLTRVDSIRTNGANPCARRCSARARCTATAHSSADAGLVNATKKPSPVWCATWPPFEAKSVRSVSSCQARSSSQASSLIALTRSVDFTMSVNMNARCTRSGAQRAANWPTSRPAASAADRVPRRSNVSRAVRASMAAASGSPSALCVLASSSRSSATS